MAKLDPDKSGYIETGEFLDAMIAYITHKMEGDDAAAADGDDGGDDDDDGDEEDAEVAEPRAFPPARLSRSPGAARLSRSAVLLCLPAGTRGP